MVQELSITRDLLPLNEAARTLGVGRSKVYYLIADGEIEAIKVGSKTCVVFESVKAFIARQPRVAIRPRIRTTQLPDSASVKRRHSA